MTTTLFHAATQSTVDAQAPMPAAPMIYNDDQTVAWERMWDSFCVLASAGGPPHRPTLLQPPPDADPASPAYQAAAGEIIRGIRLVSGLAAQPADEAGWIAVTCVNAGQARWLAEQIQQENVATTHCGVLLFVPVGEHFALKGEIKNVVTAVAKTTHYWREHLPYAVKQSLAWEVRLGTLIDGWRIWLRR